MKTATYKINSISKRSRKFVTRYVSAASEKEAIAKVNASIPACFHWGTQVSQEKAF